MGKIHYENVSRVGNYLQVLQKLFISQWEYHLDINREDSDYLSHNKSKDVNDILFAVYQTMICSII